MIIADDLRRDGASPSLLVKGGIGMRSGRYRVVGTARDVGGRTAIGGGIEAVFD